mmetsp:Transcript_66398/g.151941  ORF Transcript_66398/g.151941 Transcript_66398/m.151941 type:complete len:261 (-) Transcript_66398:1234-2016(-)
MERPREGSEVLPTDICLTDICLSALRSAHGTLPLCLRQARSDAAKVSLSPDTAAEDTALGRLSSRLVFRASTPSPRTRATAPPPKQSTTRKTNHTGAWRTATIVTCPLDRILTVTSRSCSGKAGGGCTGGVATTFWGGAASRISTDQGPCSEGLARLESGLVGSASPRSPPFVAGSGGGVPPAVSPAPCPALHSTVLSSQGMPSSLGATGQPQGSSTKSWLPGLSGSAIITLASMLRDTICSSKRSCSRAAVMCGHFASR